MVEGSLEVKLPTIWTNEKQRWEESEKRREEERRSQKRKLQKKEDPGARKGRKVAKHYVFPMICGSGGPKRRLAKAAGAEPAGQNEKLHAVVARSTFRSQNVQNTPGPDHFWKLRCRKSARRCGAKHISKSKCTKHTMFGPLLEVAMSKKCTPQWREAHFEVKKYKTHHVRTTFGSWDVEKVHAVVGRSTFQSQNVQNTPCSDHFWKLRCRKSARRRGAKHISKSKCTKHTMLEPLLDVQMSFRVAGARDCAPCQKWAEKREGFVAFSTTTTTTPHCIPIHNTTTTPSLHSTNYTALHYTTLNYIQLHSITPNYTTLHYIPLHYTTLHYSTLHYTTLHYTTLHYVPLHYTTLHYTTLRYTTLHYATTTLITLHSTTPHLTTLHSITLHYTTLPHIALLYITLHDTRYTTTNATATTLH